MQEFTIANNATALKVFLEEYATDYFDSVDVSVDGGAVFTTCTKNGASTTIRCFTASPNGIQINRTNTLTFSNYSSMRIAYAYVCDSAIVLIPVLKCIDSITWESICKKAYKKDKVNAHLEKIRQYHNAGDEMRRCILYLFKHHESLNDIDLQTYTTEKKRINELEKRMKQQTVAMPAVKRKAI